MASRSACSASRRALDELRTCRARSRRALLLISSARCPWIAPQSGVTTSSHRWRSAPLRALRAPAAASRLGVSMACSASRRALDELLTCRARSRRALLLIRSARCPWIAPPSGVTTSSHRWRSAPLRGLRAPAAASRLGVSMACSASRRALDELRACRARSRRALLPINSARRPWIAPQSGVTTSSRRWRSAALRAFRAPAAAVRCGVSIGVLGVTASS